MPNVAVWVRSRRLSVTTRVGRLKEPVHRVSVSVMVPKSAYRYSPRTIQLCHSILSMPPPIVKPSFVVTSVITDGASPALLKPFGRPQTPFGDVLHVDVASIRCEAGPRVA